jgi:UDP-N-acetylmuramoyl-L-alanyl-D-glutamate--2,6-diaminopimelate ligase
MKITELIKSLDTFNNHSNLIEDFQVRGISCNSKQVSDDFIFVAIKGTREDGNRFIAEAIENGARAIILEKSRTQELQNSGNVTFIRVKDTRLALAKLAVLFFGNPSSKIKVIGITGTNGKTTVSYLMEALLKEAKADISVIGTINYRFKDKIIQSKNTTPGPIELQSMLAQMQKEGITHCLMEVSSHALDQDRTEGIDFHSAVFTNLTQDHLDYHKTLEEYFQAKAKLFKNINPDSFAVINNDDRYGLRLKKLTKAKIITYGIENKADVTAMDIRFDSLYTEFQLAIPEGKVRFRSRLIGRHNVYNLLATAAWALKCGIDISIIKSSLEGFYFVPGRLERIDFAGDFSIFVDYAHTEDALKNAIETLKYLYKKRIIVVFGCGGERDKTKRPKMGRTVSELSDYAIITNDNPRSEDPDEIIKDIKRGIRKNNYCVIPERREAIKKSLSLAKTGDIVLVAGKGHENYQIMKDRVIHFDDREVIRECLKLLNY